jgi:WS/DGAT/MGAT family acyltransferase
LTRQDAAIYALGSRNNPLHIGWLAVVDNRDGALNHAGLVELVGRRLPLVPRYRCKIREIPFNLGGPVWVPDANFAVTRHLRHLTLPEPGSDDQLHELVARLSQRRLDPARPLWEMHLIDGLEHGRSAIFVKSHAALVDGAEALEIGHVILDSSRTPRPVAESDWRPDPEPSDIDLAVGAIGRLVAQPERGLALARHAVFDAAGAFAAALRHATANAPGNPLNVPTSGERRFAAATTNLADYRKIKAHFGCSINDVILTVVTGALRGWMISRGRLLSDTALVRACTLMSVKGDRPGMEARQVSSFLIDLPVGEANPVIRLSHIAHANESNSAAGQSVQTRTLVHLAGFAPAGLHAMSVRSASAFTQHAFNLMVTNAPGPQTQMFIGPARMLEMYPVSPLLPNQALSIGLTSYNGRVFYGLNADRPAMADVDVVTGLLYESMEEMLNACT